MPAHACVYSYLFCLLVQTQGAYLDVFPKWLLRGAIPKDETYHSNVPPPLDYEIVVIPRSTHPNYQFTAFGKKIFLSLRRNDNIVAPDFVALLRNRDSVEKIPYSDGGCHYIHVGQEISAALSFCTNQTMQGMIFLQGEILEIYPLRSNLDLGHAKDEEVLHVIKRVSPISYNLTDDIRLPDEVMLPEEESDEFNVIEKRSDEHPKLEIGLFFDEAGYKLFSPYFNGDNKLMTDMLLAYINGIQALYHHPSIGTIIDITITHLEIFRTQPSDLPHYGGERGQLLDSFCAYNAKHNTAKDTDPKHWDMGLYVSGLDFYAVENGRRSGVTMGLATVGGVCQDKYACVIAELGTTNTFGKPYPSAGFTSVYVLAHEIGHNLGMHHDSYSNTCPKDGFIMSPSRGTNGETLWSSCSADVLKKLRSWAKCLYDKPPKAPKFDHTKFGDSPGEMYSPKMQCEVLLRDHDAELHPEKSEDICQNLHCQTPHRAGYYFAGPALEGTSCGSDKWCQGGQCVVKKKRKPNKIVKGGWSEWKTEQCTSGCLVKSKGFQVRRRLCNNPKPINTEEGCEGPSFDSDLCKDDKVCKKAKRKTTAQYATKKCFEFSKVLPELDGNGKGLQAPHEEGRLWMACAVFCQRKGTGSYYTPRLDLNDLGVDPYFPDGTLCHNDGKTNFYCRHHHCLPENSRMGKSFFWSEDVPLPQNAPPRKVPLSDLLLKYLSLDSNGHPLLNKLSPGATHTINEEDWASKDYIELPQIKL